MIINTTEDYLRKATEDLKKAGIETPTSEAGVLICSVLNCDQSFLYAYGDYVLSNVEQKLLLKMINQRTKGMPLNYITGHKEFMGLDFSVNKDVLIPRRETEILAEMVIIYVRDKYPKSGEVINILDIGCGSGCVGISLAHFLKNVFVMGIDISEKALSIAKKNANKNLVCEKMAFLEIDIMDFEALEKGLNKKFDVVVSNPPYIKNSEFADLMDEVKNYEPKSALIAGEDGLDFYKNIIGNIRNILVPEGFLAFEVGYEQAKHVHDLMSNDFINIEITKDYSGIERVVTGILIPSKE